MFHCLEQRVWIGCKFSTLIQRSKSEPSYWSNQRRLIRSHRVQVHPTVIERMKRYDYKSLPPQDDDVIVERDDIDEDIDFWDDDLE